MTKTIILMLGMVVIGIISLLIYSQTLVITNDCNKITQGKKYLFSNDEEKQIATEEYSKDIKLVEQCLDTRHSTRLNIWLNKRWVPP